MEHGGVPRFLSSDIVEDGISVAAAGNLHKFPDAIKGSVHITAQQHDRARNMSDWAKDYYRIKVRPKNQFSIFRIEHLSENDSIQITGKLADGSWGTQQWLINKGDVRLENGKLVADDERIQDAINHMYR
jgi:hypothetical protein